MKALWRGIITKLIEIEINVTGRATVFTALNQHKPKSRSEEPFIKMFY
jgi:hypothetical protein